MKVTMLTYLKHCAGGGRLDGRGYSWSTVYDVLNAEIQVIKDLGVKIHLDTRVGKDIPFLIN